MCYDVQEKIRNILDETFPISQFVHVLRSSKNNLSNAEPYSKLTL